MSRKHLPVVHADEVYEKNYATRKAIADAERAELDAAIAACGQDADEYGRHTIRDKLGLEQERVIYCCRRGGGRWDPPAPNLDDIRILHREAEVVTSGGVKYTARAITIESTRFVEHPVTRFPFRYDVSTVRLTADYRPHTPERMKAAAEARHAKALAEQEQEDARRAEIERAQLKLFEGTP